MKRFKTRWKEIKKRYCYFVKWQPEEIPGCIGLFDARVFKLDEPTVFRWENKTYTPEYLFSIIDKDRDAEIFKHINFYGVLDKLNIKRKYELKNCAFFIERISKEVDGWCHVLAYILDTSSGKVLKDFLESGCSVGISFECHRLKKQLYFYAAELPEVEGARIQTYYPSMRAFLDDRGINIGIE